MTLTLFKDNRLPILTDTITSGGTAVDLTGSTVTFSMRPANSATLKVSAASATVVSAAAGTVSYAWAANDVDVVGSYKGWWTVTTSAKTQDTPEFDLEIEEHAPASIDVPQAVGTGGVTTIYQGDAYLAANNRALFYELDLLGGAPTITGLTVTFRIEGLLEKAMTVVAKDAVYVDLTSAETTALTLGTHTFEIEATVSTGNNATLLRSTISVLADVDGP